MFRGDLECLHDMFLLLILNFFNEGLHLIYF